MFPQILSFPLLHPRSGLLLGLLVLLVFVVGLLSLLVVRVLFRSLLILKLLFLFSVGVYSGFLGPSLCNTDIFFSTPNNFSSDLVSSFSFLPSFSVGSMFCSVLSLWGYHHPAGSLFQFPSLWGYCPLLKSLKMLSMISQFVIILCMANMYKNIEQYTVTQPSPGPDITIGNFDAPPNYSAAVDFVDTPPGMSPEQRKNPSTRQLQRIQGQDNVPAQHPKQRIVCNESPHCDEETGAHWFLLLSGKSFKSLKC